MNGTLVSRSSVLLLVGLLGLAVGVGQAGAVIIDDFSGVNAPIGIFAQLPGPLPGLTATIIPGVTNGPTYGGNATSWSISYGPVPPVGAATDVKATMVETGVAGVGGAGSRTTVLAGLGVLSAAQNVAVVVNTAAGGSLAYASGPNIQGDAANGGAVTLSYAGLNLAGQTSLNVNFLNSDLASTATVKLDGAAPITLPVPASAVPETISFLISLFGLTQAQLANVTASVQIDGGTVDLDFMLDSINTTGGVPEPSSLVIWGLLGIGGFGFFRVCRNNRRETPA